MAGMSWKSSVTKNPCLTKEPISWSEKTDRKRAYLCTNITTWHVATSRGACSTLHLISWIQSSLVDLYLFDPLCIFIYHGMLKYLQYPMRTYEYPQVSRFHQVWHFHRVFSLDLKSCEESMLQGHPTNPCFAKGIHHSFVEILGQSLALIGWWTLVQSGSFCKADVVWLPHDSVWLANLSMRWNPKKNWRCPVSHFRQFIRWLIMIYYFLQWWFCLWLWIAILFYCGLSWMFINIMLIFIR